MMVSSLVANQHIDNGMDASCQACGDCAAGSDLPEACCLDDCGNNEKCCKCGIGSESIACVDEDEECPTDCTAWIKSISMQPCSPQVVAFLLRQALEDCNSFLGNRFLTVQKNIWIHVA